LPDETPVPSRYFWYPQSMARSPRSDRPVTAARNAAARRGRPSNERFRALFTRNLSLLLDQRADVPREPAARAAELARVCGVTPAAARKWLTGAGWPTLEKLLELAHRYDFAPDDLLSDGPRQIVDISRLIDALALRRAELAELTPVHDFGSAGRTLSLAIDPEALSGDGPVSDSLRPAAAPESARSAQMAPLAQSAQSVQWVQWVMPDDSMLPVCAAGDRIVCQLDPTWTGDGLYLIQMAAGAPPILRRIARHTDAYRISALNPHTLSPPFSVPALAASEAESLGGAPIVRGRPHCLLRALPASYG